MESGRRLFTAVLVCFHCHVGAVNGGAALTGKKSKARKSRERGAGTEDAAAPGQMATVAAAGSPTATAGQPAASSPAAAPSRRSQPSLPVQGMTGGSPEWAGPRGVRMRAVPAEELSEKRDR